MLIADAISAAGGVDVVTFADSDTDVDVADDADVDAANDNAI